MANETPTQHQSTTANLNEEIIFKIKLKSSKLQAFALIFFSISKANCANVFKQVFASLKPNLFQELPIEANWLFIKEKMFDFSMKKKDILNPAITEDIMVAVSSMLAEDEFRAEILDYAQRENYGMLNEAIKRKLADVIPGRIELQCELEKFINRPEDQKSEIKEKKSIKDVKKLDPKKPTFLQIEPIEDKLFGKKIGNFKAGNIVVVNITDTSVSNSELENLPTRKYGKFYSSFVEFYTENDKKFVVVKLGENVFGRFEVNKEDMLRRIKTVIKEEDSEVNKLKFVTDNTFLFYLILLTTATVLTVLSWFYYSWMFD